MKYSIIVSLLIIAVAALFGWRNHEELKRVTIEHRLLVDEAIELGLSTEGPGQGLALRRPLDREKKDREAEMRLFATELIAFLKKLEDRQQDGGGDGEDMQRETMEMISRFLDLDEGQLQGVIAALEKSTEIGDDMRKGIIGFSIMMLADQSPEVVLALYAGASGGQGVEGMDEKVIEASLSRLAERDPFAAIDWLREHGKSKPDLISDDIKSALIAGTARQDPAMAITLMKELEIKDKSQAADGIAIAADTSEKRLQLLESLRALDGESRGLQESVLESLGEQLQKSGFDTSQEWLEKAELNEEELESFSAELSYQHTLEDTGNWLGWVDENLSEKEASSKAAEMMVQWTHNDFQAAGNWLNDAQEGAVKTAAIESYAKTVAPYEPQAAAQWALTLPEGRPRDRLIKQVYNEWKKKDEGAAANFAATQGID
ncbi:hypothetical protein ACFQY0_04700 [Haloferula chungangensis]|uniref:HEAT repeat domain-containing protein n=1 Tax=Haloferula chungangensis TaxID=1048331 RepID=A0ABW2L2C4_9BACT